uniref:Glycoprotein A33 n=1 Tax=Naja naja TaxID=35670 RepID=A0A8C6VGM3_NAJNA
PTGFLYASSGNLSTTLTCTFLSYLGRISYQGRLRFSNNLENGDAGITLDQVTMQDNGTYECLVEIRNIFPSKSVDVELLVLVSPSNPVCEIIGNPEYGQNINLTCNSVEGSPEPKYTWQSYDIQNKSRPLEGIAIGGMLMLKNVSINTTGYYICLSRNTAGENKCNLTVAIRPPSMNIALYAGIIGGILAAVIIISVLVYCCCCRKSKNKDYEATILLGCIVKPFYAFCPLQMIGGF